jgi:hypothetical protein
MCRDYRFKNMTSTLKSYHLKQREISLEDIVKVWIRIYPGHARSSTARVLVSDLKSHAV